MSKKKEQPEDSIQSIKGFNTDLTCRGFQFEPGKTYTVDGKAKCCGNGFHACPEDIHPLSVFGFYAPGQSRYFTVTQSGDICRREDDKAASTILTVNIEIGIGDLVKRAWDWVWERAIKSDDAHVTIDQGAASSTGTQGAAMSSGYQGKVMGAAGNALFAVERNSNYEIISIAAGIVDQDGIEANVWYVCAAGKLVPAA